MRQEELWPPLERFTLDQFDQIRDRQRYRQRDHRHGEGDTDTALHLGYRSTPRAQEERKMRGRERTNAEGGRERGERTKKPEGTLWRDGARTADIAPERVGSDR